MTSTSGRASAGARVGSTTAGDAADDAAAEWVRPRPGAAGYRNDAIVAGALAVAAWLSSFLYGGAMDQHTPPWAAALWAVAIAGSLAFRRRFPELVALVVAATFVIGQYSGIYEQLFANITLFLALYSVGAWGRNRMLATAVRIVIAAGMVLWLVAVLAYQAITPDATPEMSREGPFSQFLAAGLISIVTNLLYFGAAYVFGNASYTAARQREALEVRTRELEAEREVSSRQAVALERVRIARELHDVVAHHVSVMGLQAGAARRMLAKTATPSPDPRVTESLGAIESSAREAVDELHRMLGALRSSGPDDGDGASGTGPAGTPGDGSGPDDASRSSSTRGIAQLDELVDEARGAGLPVEFSTIGTPVAVPAVVGLSVYRIAQESLTNVRKHGGSRATVDLRLRYLDDAVEIDVSDTGAGAGARRPGGGGDTGGRTETSSGTGTDTGPRTGTRASGAPGGLGGLGQIGMRERVAAVGGELELGPRARGGYRVRARLPLAPSRPAAPGAAPGASVAAPGASVAAPAPRPAPLITPPAPEEASR